MRKSNSMSNDVDLGELSVRTKNYSGAEIEGLVKSAASFALNKQIDVGDGVKLKEGDIVVNKGDFERALEEVRPAFGIDNEEFSNCMRNGVINYGPRVEKLLHNGNLFVQQVKYSDRTPLVSLLLEGSQGSGKTALAAKLATESGYPFVKLISPELLVGYSETGKCSKMQKVFDDAYKSPISCIVVDDVERLLDYVRIGPRFSNAVLQTLLVFLKKEPPNGKRLLIISTTSNRRVLEEMEMSDAFHAVLSVPQISSPQEFREFLAAMKIFDEVDLERAAQAFKSPISVKKLIMLTEMAKQGSTGTVFDRFFQAMGDV